MTRLLFPALIAVGLSLPAVAFAGSQDVVVENPWARASIGTSRPGAAYMVIRNTGDETVTLIGLGTEIAIRAEIHRTSTDSRGVMSMAPAGEIEMAPGSGIALAPGGLHVMLMNLKEPLKKGSSFALTLFFDDGGEALVEVPVLGVGARGPGG